jgi:predicted transposase YdaD
LSFQKGEEKYAVILDACLAMLSGGKWQFQYRYQRAGGHFMMRPSYQELRERQQERRERGSEQGKERACNQEWLLDVAEALYDHLDLLRELVRTMKRTLENKSTMKRG